MFSGGVVAALIDPVMALPEAGQQFMADGPAAMCKTISRI